MIIRIRISGILNLITAKNLRNCYPQIKDFRMAQSKIKLSGFSIPNVVYIFSQYDQKYQSKTNNFYWVSFIIIIPQILDFICICVRQR